MPKTYISVTGDTFSSISRSQFGSEMQATIIKQANPQVTVPIPVGTNMVIPTSGTSKKNFKQFGLDVRIDGSSFEVYDSFICTMAIDGFGRVNFVVPNEIQTRAVLPLMTPLSVDIGYNGFSMFSGFVETPQPQENGNKSLLIDSSSWPNLLSTPASVTAYPLEFKDSNLEVIANELVKPYDIECFFYSEPGPVFKKVSIKQGENVYEFLAKLAKQRGLIIRDDSYGSLIFDKGEISGSPVLNIDSESRPDVIVGPVVVSTSEYFSSVTGVLKGKNGRRRVGLTANNPHYVGILRPHRFEVSDCDDGELATAVESIAGRMFASCFKLPVTIPGWLDENGELIEPGKSIMVKSPKDYIEDFYELLIATVSFASDGKSKSTTMECVIPGVYSAIIPETVPWK